ncbi:MAG: Arabinoxylan arabinofuranohydrolase precursor [Bacteroidetes bacterium ADurb.Bin416]|nr:MAG: Arabinoxylan arabinofuranohydrolase precursor [Bacteroidetes bacterium ADurb.Bin416]
MKEATDPLIRGKKLPLVVLTVNFHQAYHMKHLCYALLLSMILPALFAQPLTAAPSSNTPHVTANSPGAGNPLLPGYFADPTIVKFGDIYYIYATTDNEMLASGAPTLWYSNDMQHWYNYIMDVPTLSSVNLRNFWAPDIIKGDNGLYYLYFGNCQAGCNIYGYYSEQPEGPWKKLHADDKPVIEVGFPRRGFPSLDAQFFKDDDGKIYAYWGTWVHYNGGYAAGELDNKTMASMKSGVNIPLEQTPEPFEAAYMMKRNGYYILMYSGASCHDETYNVRYAYSKNPYGPFTPGANNPILSTNADQSVHGPGHHSVLENDGDYYIVYHRHDYPMTRGGMSRQTCIDSLIFDNDSTIRTVIPSHKGIAPIVKSKMPTDRAFGVKTTASSYYQLNTKGLVYDYLPSYATDRNNATLWKAATNSFPQHLVLDLGKTRTIRRVMTQFEFASYYYQYVLEYSKDGQTWSVYADRSNNRTPGSPMIDDNTVKARYLRLKVLGTEKTGLLAAVWNIMVYDKLFETPLPLINQPSNEGPAVVSSKSTLIDINARTASEPLTEVTNQGTLGSVFTRRGDVGLTTDEDGINAFSFSGGSLVLKDVAVPAQLAWNGAFTVATWVKNPTVEREGECLFSWCNRRVWGLANSYNALFYNSSGHGAVAHLDGHFDMRYRPLPAANQWHHIVLTFDGVEERIYVDGQLNNAQLMTLASAIERARFIVGSSDTGEAFSGLMASLRLYDYALTPNDVTTLGKTTKPY